MTPDTLKPWRARLGLGEAGMAAYLGVPVNTYKKWENGTRKPESSALRVGDLLARIESLAPQLHAALIAEAKTAAEPRKRGREPKVVPTPSPAPENPPAVDPGPAPGLPSWMIGGAS